MSDVKCTIPADMLRFTASALYELAIRQREAAGKFPTIDGKISTTASELLEQAAVAWKAANFYAELYQQRPNEKEAQA